MHNSIFYAYCNVISQEMLEFCWKELPCRSSVSGGTVLSEHDIPVPLSASTLVKMPVGPPGNPDDLLVFGGLREDGCCVSSVRLYDLRNRHWKYMFTREELTTEQKKCEETMDASFLPDSGRVVPRCGHCSIINPLNKAEMLTFFGMNVETERYYRHLWSLSIDASYTLGWERKPCSGTFPSPRWNSSTVEVDNRIICFGGEGPDYQPLDDIHILSVSEMKWHEPFCTLPRPEPRHLHTMSAMSTNILLFGGVGLMDDLHPLWIFDARRMSWRTVSLKRRNPFTVDGKVKSISGSVSCGLDDYTVIIHGGVRDADPLTDVWLFDLRNEEFVKLRSLSEDVDRWKHSACMIDDSTICTFGGISATGKLGDIHFLQLAF